MVWTTDCGISQALQGPSITTVGSPDLCCCRIAWDASDARRRAPRTGPGLRRLQSPRNPKLRSFGEASGSSPQATKAKAEKTQRPDPSALGLPGRRIFVPVAPKPRYSRRNPMSPREIPTPLPGLPEHPRVPAGQRGGPS